MSSPEAPPLFVIPCAAYAAVVWCPVAGSGAIADVRFGDRPAAIRGRKKLFRPGQALEALLVDGVSFRDGAACELHLNTPSGGVTVAPRRARLARWEHADTRSVLKLVASRFADEIDDPRAFERYLAFISAWQAPGRVIQAFADGCLIDVQADIPADRLQAYAMTARGLSSPVLQIVSIDRGRVVLWLGETDVQTLFLESADTLIRIAVNSPYPPESASGCSSSTEHPALLEALHGTVPNPSPDLVAWAARQCKTRLAIQCEETCVEVLRAVRLPSQETTFFIRVTGGEEFHTLQVTAFGGRDPLSADIVTRETLGATGEWQQQTIVRLPAAEEAFGCYRLSWLCGEHESVVWIRETGAGEPDHAALAREFSALTSVHPELFSRVLHPLASTLTREVAPGLVQVTEAAAGDTAACADVFVFVDRDLEAAHRTIIGLSLTAGPLPFAVHLCLFDPSFLSAMAAAVQSWSRLYRLPLHLRCYSARTTEAQALEHVLGGARPRIFCRAGMIPPRSDWLSSLLTRLDSGLAHLVLGVSSLASDSPSNSPLNLIERLVAESSPDLHHYAAAVAVAPAYTPSILDRQVLTLEGFVLAQAFAQSGAGTPFDIVPELSFIPSGPLVTAGEFDCCVDSYSLQKLAKSLSVRSRQVKVLRGRRASSSGSRLSQASRA